MSKMPAKKKSCFQITSVTQAQVAASNATDDTESLDDPDESRTEDVSSEIFDMSRADYEPEVCNRSSSEETLNNVGESELLYIQSGQIPTLPGPPDGGFTVRPVGSTSFTVINQQGNGSGQFSGTQRQLPVPAGTGVPTTVHASTSLPAVAGSITSTNNTPTSCSSRFRVIKLDHGTGEPFRRGRWTCTEFYEKDPEGSVTSRTVDSIRHPNASEVGPDRDSGLGTTVGSTAAQSGLSGQGADAIVETAQLSTTLLETQQQQQQQAVQGLAAYDAFSNKPGAAPALAQGQGGAHTAAPPSLTPPGAPHQDVHIQKTPGMPPTPQTPPLAYPAQPPPPQSQPHGLQMQNQPALIPASQAEYSQQHLPITVAQTLPSAGVSTQGLSSGLAPAPGGAQVLGVAGDMMVVSMSGVPLPGSQPVTSPAPSLVQQQAGGAMVGSVASAPPGGTGQQLQQPPVSQYNPPGVIHGVSMALQGAQALPSAVLAGASGGGVLMPNASPAMLGQSAQVPRNGMVAGSAASPGVGFIPPDEGQRQADALPLVPAISGKDMANPLIPDALHLASPAVNSLFGISIPIDGDDDRNPSTAFYQAFQSGSRLRDSKSLGDSASGASVVAIDNKIEQAMDLVKSHLMYAVREEVEVLKEQIKELYERNSVLERENAVLKSLANSEQLSQLSVQPPSNSGGTPPPSGLSKSPAPVTQTQIPPALEVPHAMASPPAPQPNVTSA